MAEPLDITTLNRFMDLADDLADAAGEVLNHYFRTPMRVDSKRDESPVPSTAYWGKSSTR